MKLELRDAEVGLIETVGLMAERVGVARIAGRLLGLMLIAPEPLALDEIAELLRVSKASISTNSRVLVRVGLVEEVSFPGDRRTYFRFHQRAWEERFELARHIGQLVESVARTGLAAVGPDNAAARARLEYTVEFASYFQDGVGRLRDEWLALHPEPLSIPRSPR